jgi:hypothetical protein
LQFRIAQARSEVADALRRRTIQFDKRSIESHGLFS